MKHLRFYFDVISPFAYLAFERLPRALENLHEWLFSLAHLARQVIFLGLSFSARIKAPRARTTAAYTSVRRASSSDWVASTDQSAEAAVQASSAVATSGHQ